MADNLENAMQYASEFRLEVCELCTVSGLKLDLTEQCAGVNIFEDIFTNAITGDISFVDTNNLISNAPIIGQEKLRLKLSTPQGDATNRMNSIDFTDVPLNVFKINSSLQYNDNTTTFVLSFTTSEFIRNNRLRLSQSFEGEPAEDIVKKIIRDEELLNSKKEFFFEKTSNNFRFIAPSVRPFDFINQVAKRCLSANYNYQPSYVFYETTKGYFFRSIDSMMDVKNPKMVFREIMANELDESTGTINPARNLENIISYEIVSQTNTLFNTRTGMYGGKLTAVDLYNKQLKNYTYNYIDDFDKSLHTDNYSLFGGSSQQPVLSTAKDEFDNRISDYPEQAIYCQTTDRETPDGLYNSSFDQQFDYNGVDQWVMQRRSRMSQIQSALTMRVEVPGNTILQAGDLIGMVLRTKSTGDGEADPYRTGRYLIKKLRHEFQIGQGQAHHFVHMEVVRDNISQPYPSAGVNCPVGGSSLDREMPKGSEDPSDVVF